MTSVSGKRKPGPSHCCIPSSLQFLLKSPRTNPLYLTGGDAFLWELPLLLTCPRTPSLVLSKREAESPTCAPGPGGLALRAAPLLLALSPHSRKEEAGPVPPGAPPGHSRGHCKNGPRGHYPHDNFFMPLRGHSQGRAPSPSPDPNFCLADPGHEQSVAFVLCLKVPKRLHTLSAPSSRPGHVSWADQRREVPGVGAGGGVRGVVSFCIFVSVTRPQGGGRAEAAEAVEAACLPAPGAPDVRIWSRGQGGRIPVPRV